MNSFMSVVLYSIPAIIVGVLAYLLIRAFLKNEESQRNKERLLENQKILVPVKLQAYERLILFLERISPYSLIPRVNKGKVTSKQFQSLLLNSVRAEYEHNLSQQIYISHQAWEMIKNAKINTTKLINVSADELGKDASSTDLATLILQKQIELENKPTEIAIRFLKSEIKKALW